MAAVRRGGAPRTPAAVAHVSFLTHGGRRFLWIGLGLSLLSVLLYLIHDPVEGRTGSTWLGYTLGTLGALLIAWLAWLGIRKRQFNSGRGSLVGWVSAHVYLGLSLLVVGTLHAGFELGWNVHSLAYVLMVAVILTGIYGVIAYAMLPARITAGREQFEFRAMVEQFNDLNDSLLALADRVDPEIHAVVARSVSRTRVGGGAWQQLSGRYPKPGEQSAIEKMFASLQAPAQAQARDSEQQTTWRQNTTTRTGTRTGADITHSDATVMALGKRIFESRANPHGDEVQKLIQALAMRNALRRRINHDITLRARMSVWLYLHVPLTVALLMALLAHVLSVFLYW